MGSRMGHVNMSGCCSAGGLLTASCAVALQGQNNEVEDIGDASAICVCSPSGGRRRRRRSDHK